MNIIRLKLNSLYILALLIVLSCQNIYAKDFDINGNIVSISSVVTKKKVYKDTDTLYTGDTSASSSNIWEEKDDKVKVKISIYNSNPYETLKVKIKEDISPYFKLTSGNINNGIESLSVSSGTKRDTNYEYKYEKTIFMQDVDHVVYGDDIRIDENGIDIRYEENNRDIKLEENNKNIEFKDINTDIELEEYIKKNNIKIPEGVNDKFKYVSKMMQGSYGVVEMEETEVEEIEYIENSKKSENSSNLAYESTISDINHSRISDDEEIDRQIENNIRIILIVVIIFVICLVVLFIFYVFMRSYQNKDIDFDKYIGQIVIILAISMLLSIGSKAMASNYTPKIYEYGKTYEKTIYTIVKFDEKYYRFNYVVTIEYTHNNEISDYETDTDGDSLVDALEYQYMTDLTKVDTDGDGLSDYIEVMILNYDPNKKDTFNDGIDDGNRDYDNDGLSNIEEVGYGTSLENNDTDYDTLSDYDEINKYNINPLSIDTDEDGLSDADEIKLGLDPNNKRTDGVTLDSERKIEQIYTITKVPEELRKGEIFIKNINGKVSGVIDDVLIVKENNSEIFKVSDVFVSDGFEILIDNDDEIDIELDASKVSERISVLTLVKYVDNTIIVVDTVSNGNVLEASIDESGIYIVVDSEILLRDASIFVKEYID